MLKQAPKSETSAIQWLLDSDPSIRWQAMRDLTATPAEVVAAERSRVASEGWGAQILGRQRPDGNFGDGITTPHWRSNLYTLLLLRHLGVDPMSEPAKKAVGLVRERVTWGPEWGNSPFFAGEVEPCINGGVLALGGYFGETSDPLVDRLLSEQLVDGGWNCEAERGKVRSSFHTTICVLEGLQEYEKAKGAATAVTEARIRAQEYLLERRLFRKLSTGEVIDPRKGSKSMPSWARFTFPTMWQYDVLRGLDCLRSAGVERDERVAEAVGLVAERRQPDGRWPLDQSPRDAFDAELEGGPGQPSRWITLRALRVLDWYSTQERAPPASIESPSVGRGLAIPAKPISPLPACW